MNNKWCCWSRSRFFLSHRVTLKDGVLVDIQRDLEYQMDSLKMKSLLIVLVAAAAVFVGGVNTKPRHREIKRALAVAPIKQTNKFDMENNTTKKDSLVDLLQTVEKDAQNNSRATTQHSNEPYKSNDVSFHATSSNLKVNVVNVDDEKSQVKKNNKKKGNKESIEGVEQFVSELEKAKKHSSKAVLRHGRHKLVVKPVDFHKLFDNMVLMRKEEQSKSVNTNEGGTAGDSDSLSGSGEERGSAASLGDESSDEEGPKRRHDSQHGVATQKVNLPARQKHKHDRKQDNDRTERFPGIGVQSIDGMPGNGIEGMAGNGIQGMAGNGMQGMGGIPDITENNMAGTAGFSTQDLGGSWKSISDIVNKVEANEFQTTGIRGTGISGLRNYNGLTDGLSSFSGGKTAEMMNYGMNGLQGGVDANKQESPISSENSMLNGGLASMYGPNSMGSEPSSFQGMGPSMTKSSMQMLQDEQQMEMMERSAAQFNSMGMNRDTRPPPEVPIIAPPMGNLDESLFNSYRHSLPEFEHHVPREFEHLPPRDISPYFAPQQEYRRISPYFGRSDADDDDDEYPDEGANGDRPPEEGYYGNESRPEEEGEKKRSHVKGKQRQAHAHRDHKKHFTRRVLHGKKHKHNQTTREAGDSR
ncbi:uncharacterized protein LOC116620043 [Nematostella vectensis]|uniref:uncharacterized protein LOC116620043 n=1 Tax=Nematostella vectensis TaxID=45351 RepID=UPI0013906733|nr:uncharacterized protein LOC116620043 [Nematostella vectensis]